MQNKRNQMSKQGYWWALPALAIALLAALAPGEALAATAGNLPWEQPAEKVAKSLMYTMRWVALIGFFASIGVLLFGGELPEWGRRIAVIVLALSVALAGSTFVTTLFSSSGAILP